MAVYAPKIFSLKEKASTQVAINLCQSTSFKEVAMNLEKPTYGRLLYELPFPAPSYFVSDPVILSAWDRVRDDERLFGAFRESYLCEDEQLERWNAAVDEQCLKLTEDVPLPDPLKRGIRHRIRRIALEYLAYVRRQEMFFEVPRYSLMTDLTVEDWEPDGRIDEERVARRLLEDERLNFVQKYFIACVYCLKDYVERFWNGFNREGKTFFSGDRGLDHVGGGLVGLWSQFMDGRLEEQLLWTAAASESIRSGNRAALRRCWERLERGQWKLIDRTLEALRRWKKVNFTKVEHELVSPLVPGAPGHVEDCTPASYCGEMLVFLLSRMDAEHMQAFFKRVFRRRSLYKRLFYVKFLLEWPHQDYFLPTVRQLWGIIPEEAFDRWLTALTEKYSGAYEKANCDYDYRSLLSALWEETPKEYKDYNLCTKRENPHRRSETGTLLCLLLERSPFRKEDQTLFERVFSDQPREQRREMMLAGSNDGEFICSQLIQEEKWTFLNWLLKECLTEEEIAAFKKRVIPWVLGARLCQHLFEEDRVKLVEDIFDWCFESDEEKTKSKHEFIFGHHCLHECANLLNKRDFAAVERLIDFFLPPAEEKGRFKLRFAVQACGVMLRYYFTGDSWLEYDVWEQIDEIIAWTVEAEEKVREFKMHLLFHSGIRTHYDLVFVRRVQQKIEYFYQWFALKPEEIKQLKWDTLFTTKALAKIENELRSGSGSLLAPLRYCLTDEEMVDSFKSEVKRHFRFHWEEEHLDKLLDNLLEGIQKEVQGEANVGGNLLEDGGKRSVAIEDEADSEKKRHKQT